MSEAKIVKSNRADFDSLVDFALSTVADSSSRVYEHVYGLWVDHCSNHQIEPIDLRPVNVLPFLEAQYVTRKTRKRYMSALRQLVKAYTIAEPEIGGRLYAALKMVRIPEGNMNENERDRRALTPAQVERILSVWGGNTLLDKRNSAIIAFMFLSGVRRSEVAALKWSDINLDDAVANIRHGKGDKQRDVAIAGELAIRCLIEWQRVLPDREYVFPSFDQRMNPGEDKPTNGQTIYRVVKHTEKLSGIVFTPHTARRTFITEGLIQGASLASMQAQAGHSRGETTLDYARPIEAKQRRQEFRHRYGD